jgi:hypothetical protein
MHFSILFDWCADIFRIKAIERSTERPQTEVPDMVTDMCPKRQSHPKVTKICSTDLQAENRVIGKDFVNIDTMNDIDFFNHIFSTINYDI